MLRLRIINASRDELAPEQQLAEFRGHGGTIGRSLDNDWVLPDQKRYISSRHAVIDCQAGAWYLVDTSRNGVYVNGADTPVGRGMPQRLFDGDRLRMGEFELGVEVTEEADEPADDGMRDSIVRAQLASEEESVELMLVPENRLLHDSVLQRHLTASSGVVGRIAPAAARRQQPAAASAARATAPRAAAPAAPAPAAVTAPAEDTDAVGRFLSAAGLPADAVNGRSPDELMHVAGRLVRVMTGGLMDLLAEQARVRDAWRISDPAAQKQGQNNPLRFSPNVEEALRFLLSPRAQGNYLTAEDAVRAGFKDLRQHQDATLKAMLQAVHDYSERFDPDELKRQFDKGLKRSGLLSSANKLKYWDLYEESYAALTQHEEGAAPQLFSEEFARAYGAELEAARALPATRSR